MSDPYAIGAVALTVDLERLRAVGQNLANVSTIAYRAEIPVQPAVAFSGYLDAGAAPSLLSLQSSKPGAMRQSFRPLDLAISGPGYFVLSTPDGYRYTRRGDFQLDSQGVLRSAEGFEVMGAGQGLVSDMSTVEVQKDGTIKDGSRVRGRIDVVDFSGGNILVHEGGGIYRASMAPDVAPSPDVRQGFLEQSNVDPATETVRMMETVRRVGMMTQAIRAYDAMLDAAVNQMGNGY